MSEWGVNFITSRWDYVGESEGPSVVLGGIFSAVHVDGHGRLVVVVFTEMIHFKFWDRSLAHEAYHMSFEASQF